MKKLFAFTLISFGLASNLAHAGSCGSGLVTEVKEGGWNNNHLLVRIDNSLGHGVHPDTTFHAYVRYKDDLPTKRLDGIRALASLALVSGSIVETFSHFDSCDNATELAVLTG